MDKCRAFVYNLPELNHFELQYLHSESYGIMDYSRLKVQPILATEQQRFQELMQRHHFLGAMPKIGHSLRYVVSVDETWLALLSFSAAALNLKARDDWIGWQYRHRSDRLKLVSNNTRFLILPDHHYPNLGSRILSRVEGRISRDWLLHFQQPLLLLETFVDPSRHRGTVYRAANWQQVGRTTGYRRVTGGYSERTQTPKWVFVRPLHVHARRILSAPVLPLQYQTGVPRMKLTVKQMESIYEVFQHGIEDPRRAQGRKHSLATVLALSVAAVLCGCRGYKDISVWVKALSQSARSRFRCRFRDRFYEVPSYTVIRNVLVGVDPEQLNAALNRWNAQFASVDESLAIDGKTMCNAMDENGRQAHIMSVVGHQSKQVYSQKKSVRSHGGAAMS